MRVLLVTTNARVSGQVTTALLGERAVDLLEVRTPQRALQQIDDVGGIDLVIADADTAPTGGFALSREIKARGEMGRDVPPIVLLIARDQDKFLAKWSRADAYVRKPPDPFDLAAVIKAVAAGEPVPELPGVGSAQGPLPGDLQMLEEQSTQAGAPLTAGP